MTCLNIQIVVIILCKSFQIGLSSWNWVAGNLVVIGIRLAVLESCLQGHLQADKPLFNRIPLKLHVSTSVYLLIHRFRQGIFCPLIPPPGPSLEERTSWQINDRYFTGVLILHALGIQLIYQGWFECIMRILTDVQIADLRLTTSKRNSKKKHINCQMLVAKSSIRVMIKLETSVPWACGSGVWFGCIRVCFDVLYHFKPREICRKAVSPSRSKTETEPGWKDVQKQITVNNLVRSRHRYIYDKRFRKSQSNCCSVRRGFTRLRNNLN